MGADETRYSLKIRRGRHELREYLRYGDEGHRKNDWNHSRLVQADGKIPLHASTSPLIRVGNGKKSLGVGKEHNRNQKSYGEYCKKDEWFNLSAPREEKSTPNPRGTWRKTHP